VDRIEALTRGLNMDQNCELIPKEELLPIIPIDISYLYPVNVLKGSELLTQTLGLA
jgi:hypothetical protein